MVRPTGPAPTTRTAVVIGLLLGRRYRARAALVIDRDEGEHRLGHLDLPVVVSRAAPGRDPELDRGAADRLDLGMYRHLVADMDRLEEGEAVDRDRGATAARP